MRQTGRVAFTVAVFCVLSAIAVAAQSFDTLALFDGANGANPIAPLVQGANGNFYGTASQGGRNLCSPDSGCGTLFEVTPTGSLTSLYDFCSQAGCVDGLEPAAGLVQGTDGNFYGTTAGGGTATASICEINSGCGTVFRITPTGGLTTLYSFCTQANCTDGWRPLGGLIRGSDGNLYGTTAYGGTSNNPTDCPFSGCGTVFRITPTGRLTTLYAFCSAATCPDGMSPRAGLTQATDGNLYGTTAGPIPKFNSTIFQLTPRGTLTTLYKFCTQEYCPDGRYANSTLVQGIDGNFYGTTAEGGDEGCQYTRGCGTVFKITPAGSLTTLHVFEEQPGNDALPNGLVQATDGNLYGTTWGTGFDYGGLFEITPAGQFNMLYSFCEKPCINGSHPSAGLVQGTNGTFYGTTYFGYRDGGYGTVFNFSAGLGPFVQTNPAAARVGGTIGILGNNLTGATNVTLNGTMATTFTVVRDTLIKATVPVGATTGYVTVTTPGGTLVSNVPFQVIP